MLKLSLDQKLDQSPKPRLNTYFFHSPEGLYHSPRFRVMSLAGDLNNASSSRTNSGTTSLPTCTIVLPLPLINTELTPAVPAPRNLSFNAWSSGSLLNAGASKSFTHIVSSHLPWLVIFSNRSNGSSVERESRSSALKMAVNKT